MKRIVSENLMIVAKVVKGITGVLGGAVILENNHPYIAITILSIGAGINELILYVEKKRNGEK